jgi:hypothetical protein
MFITENEAKKKWCPFIQISDNQDYMSSICTNRGFDIETYKCIASECMAWRVELKSGLNRPDTGCCGLAAIKGKLWE